MLQHLEERILLPGPVAGLEQAVAGRRFLGGGRRGHLAKEQLPVLDRPKS
jgi:hypothetical protein